MSNDHVGMDIKAIENMLKPKNDKWRCITPCVELMNCKKELAQSLEYQDSLHEKIATLEAEVDCRILLSEHNRIVEELKARETAMLEKAKDDVICEILLWSGAVTIGELCDVYRQKNPQENYDEGYKKGFQDGKKSISSPQVQN
jgi:hypothetical protein